MLRPTLRPHADQTPAQAGPSAPTNPAPIAAPSLTTMPPTYPFPHLRGNGIRAECRFATVVLGSGPHRCGRSPRPQPRALLLPHRRDKGSAILRHGSPSVREARLGPPEQPSLLYRTKGGPP